MPVEMQSSSFLPANSAERVNALAHYYRGELSRAISWRDSLDRTTNWAIAALAAALSVSMTGSHGNHAVLLFAMPVILLLLVIEARRYRYFDVYRRRVRRFETGYYANLFSPSAGERDTGWTRDLSASLREPQFVITLRQAMAHRLRRNYIWIFLILLAAWLLKVFGQVSPDRMWEAPLDLPRNAAMGWTPGWVVLLAVLLFYAWIASIMLWHGHATRKPTLGEV